MRAFLLTSLLILLALVACGSDNTAVAPTLAPPTSQPTEPTPTAVALLPTNTAELPATLPPPPTMAFPNTPTPAPATAEPTPSGILLLTAEDFGDNRNPLTGEIVEDAALLEQRPLLVKISNAPPLYVRPQAGLNDAAWIFEHTAEGAVTRFSALFYGDLPPAIGPIRSARLIDIELAAMYDAALIYSGTSTGVGNRMFQSDIADHLVRSNEPGYYRTGDETKPFEHTLYANPTRILEGLESNNRNHAPVFNTQVAFSSESPANGRPATYATINYRSTFVEWRYDAETNRYWRRADQADILDANTEEQVSAANVVIIAPFHAEDGTICEQIADGVCVALSVQIQLWGSGQGVVLRDGQVYDVTWQRHGRNDMLTFTDANGDPFPLQIGNSWVQLIPTWLENPVEISE